MFFLYTVFTLFTSQAISSFTCTELFKQPKELVVVPSEYSINLTDKKIDISDNEYGFNFVATLDTHGILRIIAQLTLPSDGIRSHYSGKELFNFAINHFGSDKINGFEAQWYTTSINYEQYRYALRSSGDINTAVLTTWSGQQAIRHGFPNVKYISTDKKDSWGETIPLTVLFTR